MTEYVPASNHHSPSPPPPRRPARRRRIWPYAVVVVVLAAALTVVFLWPRLDGAKTDTPAAAAVATAFTVNGVLALGPGQFVAVDGTSCAGTPTYADLTVGATVTITDSVGGVLAATKITSVTLDGLGGAGTCDLKFAVPGIPAGKGSYTIQVAHRGAMKYDESKLRSGTLQLSVS
jgi:hypothetical protein